MARAKKESATRANDVLVEVYRDLGLMMAHSDDIPIKPVGEVVAPVPVAALLEYAYISLHKTNETFATFYDRWLQGRGMQGKKVREVLGADAA